MLATLKSLRWGLYMLSSCLVWSCSRPTIDDVVGVWLVADWSRSTQMASDHLRESRLKFGADGRVQVIRMPVNVSEKWEFVNGSGTWTLKEGVLRLDLSVEDERRLNTELTFIRFGLEPELLDMTNPDAGPMIRYRKTN